MSRSNHSSQVTEEQEIRLLCRIATKRDRQAMQLFYSNYRLRLGAFLHRIAKNQGLVEEIYNDVMFVVWRKASQFNGTCKVSTWLFAIAYRAGLKRLSKEKKHLLADENLEIITNIEETTEVSNDQQEIISKALTELSFEHRTVIELAYYVGNNYAEIAEITDTPENTVKTRIFYARKKLQEALKTLGVTSMASN